MIGKRLSQMISESALKKQDAAKLIGRSPGTISNWVRDENFQNNSDFFKLCRLKGWNPDWIISGKGDKFVEIGVNLANEPVHNYGSDQVAKLMGQVELLKEQLKEKDQYIMELLELCDKKNIKRGAHSG